ncbi:MAG: excinuclease ABC subunit UvrB [Elusimicrobiota bacterium]|jgi:excinuclease ABC subunit B|nr:excinuclease ABC subunit UvrB [Elusimicrobiota bacterium]
MSKFENKNSLSLFHLTSKFTPSGDQPKAINELLKNLDENKNHQILLGVTGSGKTFTIANVIQKFNKPTLILSPNKTLAAQLYSEFKAFFPNDAVEYFISYYDYYQPEAYIPQSDTYIEKDAAVNEKIDRLRLRTTTSLLTQKNCIVIASVSCIYGLGSPDDYKGMIIMLDKNKSFNRKDFLNDLISLQYNRNDKFFEQGCFRIKGNIIDIFPPYLETAFRIEFFDDEIEKMIIFDPLTGKKLNERQTFVIYPAKHFVMRQTKLENAIKKIKNELSIRLKQLEAEKKMVEAYRLKQKVEYDIEILNEMGYCNGIENYSRHITGRNEGEPPFCLIDYFEDEFLTIIDESHIAIPQIRGMYNGDRARKENLVNYGFRLPSALDNRPLKFDEFEKKIHSVIYVSATPGDYEIEISKNNIVEQIIRPTGLVDPLVSIRPTNNMMENVFHEVNKVIDRKERILITTLTKKMAEELTEYLIEHDIKAKYLHSEIDALARVKILTDFRQGNFDCLVGINLLREGLDLPEVSLVIILDADKEGFLRSERSLIQTSGRAARNVNGKILMFADEITGSMERAISEMNRRRQIQIDYNIKNNITPKTIKKDIDKELSDYGEKGEVENKSKNNKNVFKEKMNLEYFARNKKDIIKELKEEMKIAVDNWDFEKAAKLRDQIKIFDLEK